MSRVVSECNDDWLLEDDAPLSLPLKPAQPRSMSRSASRAASRAASRGSGSRPASRLASRPVSRLAADGTTLSFPPKSAAAALLHPPPSLDDAASEDAPPPPPPLFFVQLPTNLPLTASHRQRRAVSGPDYLSALASAVPTEVGDAAAGASAIPSASGASLKGGRERPATLAELGAGPLGELIVRRSGKVSLRIGELVLDVQPGTACSIDQEIVAMNMPGAPGGDVDMYRLGKLHERLVVTPDLDHLLGKLG